jgi:tRNA dimethylallyltransferase
MIYVITGPTGSGKSRLALEFAKIIHGQIINADAFQVYRGLDIGTNKSSAAEQASIKHHLIDIVDPNQGYDVARYQKDARATIASLQNQNIPIIICGGTGLYIRAALYNYVFAQEDGIVTDHGSATTESLYEKLREVDPLAATAIHRNNRQRIMRALDIFIKTGTTKSAHLSQNKPDLLYECRFVAIDQPRDQLYERVDRRVDAMVEAGLVSEAKSLFDHYGSQAQAFQAIGYKQLIDYFEKRSTLAETLNNIKMATRHYVKRQYTFFRHQLPVEWFPDHGTALDALLKEHASHG